MLPCGSFNKVVLPTGRASRLLSIPRHDRGMTRHSARRRCDGCGGRGPYAAPHQLSTSVTRRPRIPQRGDPDRARERTSLGTPHARASNALGPAAAQPDGALHRRQEKAGRAADPTCPVAPFGRTRRNPAGRFAGRIPNRI